MSEDNKVIAMKMFMDTVSRDELAEYIVALNNAVDGLTQNNRAFASAFQSMFDNTAKLHKRVEELQSLLETTKPGEFSDFLRRKLLDDLALANADAYRLAAELRLEQNPGHTCLALQLHEERVKGSKG